MIFDFFEHFGGKMKKVILLALLLTTMILFADIKLIEKNETFVLYRISIDLEVQSNNQYTVIKANGWHNPGLEGEPDLPINILNFIVPTNGNLSFEISNVLSENSYLDKPISPVATIIPDEKTHKFLYEINESLYNKKSDVVSKGVLARYRYYNFIPLTIRPVRFDLDQNKLEVVSSFDLKIEITGERNEYEIINDKFKDIEKNMFENYSSGKFWQSRSESNLAMIPFDESEFWFKIEIENEGLFRLSNDMIMQIPDFLNPESARIYTTIIDPKTKKDDTLEIHQLPLLWNGSDKGKISNNDEVYFQYDLPIEEGDSKILWLSFGNSAGNQYSRLQILDEFFTPLKFESVDKPGYNIARESSGVMIIYPEEFLSEAEDLSQFYLEEFGYNTVLKEQQEIFEELSGGTAAPIAIKTYIQGFWESAAGDSLEYVILLGSGTNNWDDNTEKNRIMAYGSSDANFVSFYSNLPDLIIARYPAQNRNDLQFLIERTKNYVRNPTPGWWRNNVLIMADDENKDAGLEGVTQNGMNHTNLAQETEDLLSDGVWVDKVLGLEYEFDEYNSKPDARNATIASVNDGRLVWYYIGHGNPDVMGDEDYFRGSQHLKLLDNEEHLPLFVAASCSVGEFDSADFDCIAERLLFLDNGGSIVSIAASRSCSGKANTTIMKEFFVHAINHYDNVGYSLMAAKVFGSYTITGKLYNLLGDPLISINPPLRSGHVYNLPDSLRSRQTVSINADYETSPLLNNIATIRVLDTTTEKHFSHTIGLQTYEVDYTINGQSFFTGNIEVDNNTYLSSFTVPDDINNGDKGRIITYLWDDLQGKDFVNYYSGIKLSKDPFDAESYSSPHVNLWLESKRFQSGDYVSTNPQLIAEIEDENGINVLGSAGHKILVIIDNSLEPIDVTSSFVYYAGSHTRGELNRQLTGLTEGNHTLQLIVFDNLNNPTISEVEFNSQKSGKVAIKNLLPYPNPIEDDGYFTFVLTESADITVSIYTITGKKIRTLKMNSCEAGYNQIYWDSKDGDGDEIANNTYLYKVKAKQAETGKGSEAFGKIIILK